jgi:hypothetical protein
VSDPENPYAPPAAWPATRGRVVTVAAGTAAEACSIDIDLIVDDLAEFAAEYVGSSPSGRRQRRGFQLLFAFYAGLLALAGLGQWSSRRSFDAGILVGMGFLAIVALFYGRLQRFLARRLTRRALATGRNLGTVGPRRVTISPEAFRCEGPYTDERVRWPAIERIAVSNQALYLYVAANNGHVVPRRAFEDDGEFDSFVTLARRYREAAQLG